MKKVQVVFLFISMLFLFVACEPDLIVKEVNVTWDNSTKTVQAEIANTGNADAGNFLVYFNGDESPVSPNHRPQVRVEVPGLAKGATTVLDADFAPLAHPDNNNLGNIYQITVIADPKSMVNESNENNNEKVAAISMGAVCIDFEPPLTSGTEYGNPAGNASGDLVYTSPSGIKMSVYDFRWTNGGGTFNVARIEAPPTSFATGQAIRTNNINLDFDFTGVGFQVTYAEFKFLDMGGFENLSVNGQPVPIYAGELTAAPTPIAGVSVTSNSVPVQGGKKGLVVLTGPIQTMRVGGQEFWLDDVCVKGNP